MGVIKSPAFARNYHVDVDLANALVLVDQLLQQPPAGAVAEAASVARPNGQYLPGKWIAVAPDVASGIITRSAAQPLSQVRSVSL
jgi:hypothetical protein